MIEPVVEQTEALADEFTDGLADEAIDRPEGAATPCDLCGRCWSRCAGPRRSGP
jgi:hypothetical protein